VVWSTSARAMGAEQSTQIENPCGREGDILQLNMGCCDGRDADRPKPRRGDYYGEYKNQFMEKRPAYSYLSFSPTPMEDEHEREQAEAERIRIHVNMEKTARMGSHTRSDSRLLEN
jgi:hypothetical protein